ncbi:MAG: hypothetical protein Q4D38_12040 [Planctomycetia bacterium]|nr:hypothetical protein [Planctomycetia bacterium]
MTNITKFTFIVLFFLALPQMKAEEVSYPPYAPFNGTYAFVTEQATPYDRVASYVATPNKTEARKGYTRQEIRSMPILQRPNRPGHFYGNTVRRRHGM